MLCGDGATFLGPFRRLRAERLWWKHLLSTTIKRCNLEGDTIAIPARKPR